jgi:hypothetical protein
MRQVSEALDPNGCDAAKLLRAVTVSKDSKGAVIATVPLGPKAIYKAVIDLGDWERIVSEYSDKWNYILGPNGKRYATLGAGDNKTEMVARIITGAKKGQRVKYINGDTCDLRKENLRVVDNKR